MKKIAVLLLALALITFAACAENPYLSDWIAAYNAHAAKNDLEELRASGFEYDANEGAYYADIDPNTSLILGFNGDAVYVCGLQALVSDQRSAPIMACALAASSGDIGYDAALSAFTKLFDGLTKDGDIAYDMQGSWYLMAAIETDEDGTFLAAAFYSMDSFINAGSADGTDGADDGLPGNIWEGLEPDEETPAAPRSTPKPKEGHYKI